MTGPLLALLLAPAVLPEFAEIDGFGEVWLPGGPWVLERTHLPAGDEKLPRIVVFRRAAPWTERLTALHYPARISGRAPVYHGDSLTDSTPLGLPIFLDPNRGRQFRELGEERRSIEVLLRVPATWAESKTADRVEVTRLHGPAAPDRPNWMSHSISTVAAERDGGGTLIRLHSGERVLHPVTIDEMWVELRPPGDW